MPNMARAIEMKLATLPNPDYRLFFPDDVPFTRFGFYYRWCASRTSSEVGTTGMVDRMEEVTWA
jgi:hypothetical protein